LRVGLFDQRLTDFRQLSGAGSTLPEARLRGVRASYEGVLNRNTTFYVDFNLNDTKDVAADQDVALVPKWTGEVGLHYLNRRGWFFQPSFFYLGKRVDDDIASTRLGGFSLLNARAGKRFGLRSMVFVELVNALNKDYDILGAIQPNRHLRVGAMHRF
jgi:outer membrane receptor protein involved in Fe transport